jgi:hypothetical protein
MSSSKNNRLLVFLKDKKKKSYFKIIKECLYLWVTKKEIPFYYFKHLYKKEVTNYKDYLSTKECAKIQFNKKFHKKELVELIANKLTFSIYCSKNNLPVPKLISYNLSSCFFYDSIAYPINNIDELKIFLNLVFSKSKHNSVFIKPLSLFGGTGCFKISKETLDEDLKESSDYIINNSCIHEEVVEQHNLINQIHSKCINTIRIETYIDKKGEIHLLSSYMRFGVGTSHVDNSHAGGFYVSIDLESGKLKEKGMTLMEYGSDDIFYHPDSGFVFKDFKIPYFDEICELIIKATTFIPDRYIGWDIAISENGPVIIEANDLTSVSGADLAYGGYKKKPVFKEILEETKDTDLKNAYKI